MTTQATKLGDIVKGEQLKNQDKSKEQAVINSEARLVSIDCALGAM